MNGLLTVFLLPAGQFEPAVSLRHIQSVAEKREGGWSWHSGMAFSPSARLHLAANVPSNSRRQSHKRDGVVRDASHRLGGMFNERCSGHSVPGRKGK